MAGSEGCSTGGAYVNHLDEEDEWRTRSCYGSNWSRLRAVKTTYDPENRLCSNYNIPPYG
ncbi:MAG: BBE domain-containing protein [Acidimicrobiia bacterium]